MPRGRTSIAKHSFRDLPMPTTTVIWPLHGEKLCARMLTYLGTRSSRLSSFARGSLVDRSDASGPTRSYYGLAF